MKRRADVAGVLRWEQPTVRLIGAVPLKAHGKRQLQHRSMQAEGMASLIPPPIDG